MIANFFSKTLISRISGALVGALIFFLVTNFGVWISGMYGYTLEGFINCYNLAIPFFAYSIISTLIFSLLIEIFAKVINLSWQGITKLSLEIMDKQKYLKEYFNDLKKIIDFDNKKIQKLISVSEALLNANNNGKKH